MSRPPSTDAALPPAAQSIAEHLADDDWHPTPEELTAARCACDTPRCVPQCELDLRPKR